MFDVSIGCMRSRPSLVFGDWRVFVGLFESIIDYRWIDVVIIIDHYLRRNNRVAVAGRLY